MNALLLAATGSGFQSLGVLIHLFIWLAIICLLIWGVKALLAYWGVAIPQPVWIVLTVLGGIFLIVLIARAFGYAI